MELRKAQPEVPPGYDPGTADGVAASKPKTKSAKRNERKKEKKLQVALAASDDKGKDLDLEQAEKLKTESLIDEKQHRLEHVATVADQMSNLSVSSTSEMASPFMDQIENSGPDIDKRIRALKKKIRLAEGQLKGDHQNMKPEQLEKMAKVEGWREELKGWDNKNANLVS